MAVHDPVDRVQLSYLAASTEAKPIYVNRALSDADLVIPIGCLHPEGALGYFGVYSGIFPAFSDARHDPALPFAGCRTIAGADAPLSPRG